MARLERAIGQFMLDTQGGANGYTECLPPLLVKDEAVFGTGQLPKFAEDLFQTDVAMETVEYISAKLKAFNEMQASGKLAADADITKRRIWDLVPRPPPPPPPPSRRWLIPTAEVSLTNSVREQILPDALRRSASTALTQCFRSEAGAAGKDTRGFIRQHQFEKVELVSICRPDQWEAEHEHMMPLGRKRCSKRSACHTAKCCSAPATWARRAKKTFDLEVWLPGQGAYREISSISWCGDYQARRMNARYPPRG